MQRPSNKNKSLHWKLLAVAGLGVALLPMLGLFHEQAHRDESLLATESVDEFLSRLQDQGGQLVLCQNQSCVDLVTREMLAPQPDGVYIVYPDQRKSAQELSAEAKHLKQLMSQEQRRGI